MMPCAVEYAEAHRAAAVLIKRATRRRQGINDTFKELGKQRALARHTEELTFKELLEGAAKVLAIDGIAAFIIPYKEEIDFLELAQNTNLFPSKISRYRGNINSELKRSLIQLKNEPHKLVEEEFFLEHSRHEYSDHYKSLVKDFYLKL